MKEREHIRYEEGIVTVTVSRQLKCKVKVSIKKTQRFQNLIVWMKLISNIQIPRTYFFSSQ